MRLDVRDLTLLVLLAYLLVPQAKCSVAIVEDTWQAATTWGSPALWHAIEKLDDPGFQRILGSHDQ